MILRSYKVLPLSELVERWRIGRSLKGCCAITFDDGYRDFAEHAYPILESYSLPVTHFLVSNCVDEGIPPWTYRLNSVMRPEIERQMQMQMLGKLDTATREERLAEMCEAAEVDSDASSQRRWPRMLSAADISRFDSKLVEWGSHTRTHAFLEHSNVPDLEREVIDSKNRLEKILGRRVRYLAYPNGYFDARVLRAVEAAGYEAAFTVGQKALGLGADRFALPRFDVSGHSKEMFMLETTGIVELLRRTRSTTHSALSRVAGLVRRR